MPGTLDRGPVLQFFQVLRLHDSFDVIHGVSEEPRVGPCESSSKEGHEDGSSEGALSFRGEQSHSIFIGIKVNSVR